MKERPIKKWQPQRMMQLGMSEQKARIVDAILQERQRQDHAWGTPEIRAHDPWPAILGEEFGEVCRATLGNPDAGDLRKELIQVAAVAVAWIEALELNQ